MTATSGVTKYAFLANFAGLPAITFPIGSDAGGAYPVQNAFLHPFTCGSEDLTKANARCICIAMTVLYLR